MSPVLLFALGIIALIMRSKIIFRGISELIKRLHISSMGIGFTVGSIGTRAPELPVATVAGTHVAGTHVVNLLLILSTAHICTHGDVRR